MPEQTKPEQTNKAHAVVDKRHSPSPQQRQERKDRILNQGASSVTLGIAEAIVVKDKDVFFLTAPDGNVPMKRAHGFGLYYHDCRYLNGYELRLAGTEPDTLISTGSKGYQGLFRLTNPEIELDDGLKIHKSTLGIGWQRIMDGAIPALYDVITFENYSLQACEFPVTLAFHSQFEALFQVRGQIPKEQGKLHAPTWEGGQLKLAYDGADDIFRALTVRFSPEPESTQGTMACYTVHLEPRETCEIHVSLVITEEKEGTQQAHPPQRPDLKKLETDLAKSEQEWLNEQTQVTTSTIILDRVLNRSLRDLRLLTSDLTGQEYFAAGLPWFGTLFGRDSLITALQTLAYGPGIGEHTLRLLAKYQGQKVDEWRDEAPGKILHELRVGEMAHLNEIPQTPYYGTIDATPLFLILVGRHAAWTGDLSVFKDLKGNIDAALEWMDKYGDINGDGYLEYESKSSKGLANQGWKDSGDAIMNADGTLAKPPIALVEVQGYAYLARLLISELYRRSGDEARADKLLDQARALRAQFNKDFWMEDMGCYALALQAGHKPCKVISSNPGQALWSGIVDPEKAKKTVEKLMAPDMFDGWGIRTLSSKEKRYNPTGYHLGTVWPHDNSLIVAGLRHYGYNEHAGRVFDGIMQAATYFDSDRLPEVFSGFNREDYGMPVHYPVACHPQAWAAGAVPYMLTSMLGLVPEGFEKRLRIVEPVLPESIYSVELHGMRVAGAKVDLAFDRTHNNSIAVRVLDIQGDLDVVVEPRLPRNEGTLR